MASSCTLTWPAGIFGSPYDREQVPFLAQYPTRTLWLLQVSIKNYIYINCVSCFNVGYIFVNIFMIMHCTVMKLGMNIEAKHTNDV